MPVGGGGSIVLGNANGGKELGRISGPLLSEDLRRNGVNLAFDNDKLYLNVVNKYVGFGTNTPTRTLTAPGTSRFARTNSALSDLIATTQAEIGNLTFNDTDKIQNFTNNNIVISPAAGDQLITFNGLGSTGYFAFLNNALTGTANSEINISPAGKTIVNSSVNIDGSLHAVGNITFDGNITLGNSDTDSITFAAEVNSDLIPQILTGTISGVSDQLITEDLNLLLTEDNQNLFTDSVATPYLYSLGSSLKNWNNVYSQNLNVVDLFSTTATAGTWTQNGLTITGNSVSAGTGTTNITISGTGKVNLHDKIYIKDNTVTHNNAVVPLEFGATGVGYVKFGGTRGTVIPKGTTLQRPAAAELGTIRYNSDVNYIEVYANVSNTQVVSLSTNSVTAIPGGDLLHTLNNPNAYSTSANDNFGYSVAASGNYVIVGAFLEDDAGGTSSGKAYIYNVTTGALVHTLTNPTSYGTSAGDRFGNSVAISDNYAIVGAYRERNSGSYNPALAGFGKAYIYNVTTGALLHTLDNPTPGSYEDYFGQSVAISGNYAIVGAHYESDVYIEAGKAYIFNVTTGALLFTLRNPNPYGTQYADYFGYSVAMSGNYAIVGAYQEDDAGGTDSGKAYIYNVTTGVRVHTLNNPTSYGTSAGDQFGNSVAISGNYAVVGAYLEDDASGTNSGKAYIYNVTTGVLVHTLTNPNAYSTSAGDLFGYSVAMSGDFAIVGAYGEDDAGGTESGKAYIYNVTTGVLVYTLNNPNAYSTSAGDLFGISVAISGNYAVVGAYLEDDASGTNSGKAYIYNPNTIFTTNTVGFNVGDFISSTSDLFAFASGTIITAVTTNTSITISTPLLNTLPAGSNLTSQRKWIPIIGTSPVLGVQDVNDIQDIWALILG